MDASRKVKIVINVFFVLILGTVGIILTEKNKDTGKEVEDVLGRSNISTVPYIVAVLAVTSAEPVVMELIIFCVAMA